MRCSINIITGKVIQIQGVVQGVGFRPAVWRLANQLGLTGSVRNEGGAVIILAWGRLTALNEFILKLPANAPPAAKITRIQYQDLSIAGASAEFSIIASQPGSAQAALAADMASCQHCLDELTDNADCRFQYAFNNCTHCGPRLSIIQRIPYDRSHTAMAGFPLCPLCQAEYQDPANRRFHAQAIACPLCGPHLWLEDAGGTQVNAADPIDAIASLIRQGSIIAIKGLGGFNLLCDADNQAAVSRLRQRKQRQHKPFAIMARDTEMLANYVELDEQQRQLLGSPAAPIVLLTKQGRKLAEAVAPRQLTLGCVLAYTPLHHMLLDKLDVPVVFTSGNRIEEPPAIDNDSARQNLSGIADYWLMHNRQIEVRLDDSVVQVMDSQPRLLRRARGYAPLPVALPPGFRAGPAILAMGSELKNSFCLLKNEQAILSPHVGDLENAQVLADYRHMLDIFHNLFQFQPDYIAVDSHQGYLSTQLGQEWAVKHKLPLLTIQHHHAHIAACMAEYALPLDSDPVLGVVMDGLGMGENGQLWGGEFFLADYRQCRRLTSFQPILMPGGVQAILQPWRNTYAHLSHYFDWSVLSQQYADLDIVRFLNDQPLDILDAMLAKNINSPESSSCGRCLDAFAAALGICSAGISYEAQAAIEMEALAAPVFEQQKAYAYPYEMIDGMPGWRYFWSALLNDMQRGVDKADMAARIHHGVANAIAETAIKQAAGIGCQIIILSGGVFQNRLLLEEIGRQLRAADKLPLSPSAIPANDGGLALGQAIIAAARLQG